MDEFISLSKKEIIYLSEDPQCENCGHHQIFHELNGECKIPECEYFEGACYFVDSPVLKGA